MIPYEVVIKNAENNEALFSYPKIEFPLIWIADDPNEGTFISRNGYRIRFTEEGAGFFTERNRSFRYKDFVKLHKDKEFGFLGNLINEAIAKTKNPTAAFTCVEYHGEVIATLKYFTRITDVNILKALPDYQKQLIQEMMFSRDRSYFNILVDTLEFAGYERGYVFLRISNGSAGVYGMGCELVVQLNNFQYIKRLSNSLRHYKKIITAKDLPNFDNLYCDIEELKIGATLRDMTVDKFFELLKYYNPMPNVRQKRLIDLVKNSKIASGLEGFVLTAQFGSSSGYSIATNAVLRPLVSHIVEKKSL